MIRQLWRYRVSVVVDVLGSFEREIRAETAQQAAALALVGMGDQGPWGGGQLQLDPWLHRSEVRVTVDCLDLERTCAPLILPEASSWTLYKVKTTAVESGGSDNTPPAVPSTEGSGDLVGEPPGLSKGGGSWVPPVLGQAIDVAVDTHPGTWVYAVIETVGEVGFTYRAGLLRGEIAFGERERWRPRPPEVSKAGGCTCGVCVDCAAALAALSASHAFAVDPRSRAIPGFTVVATGDEGIHTGRPRFRVTCDRCGEVVHPNTTGPESWARGHKRQKHPTEGTS